MDPVEGVLGLRGPLKVIMGQYGAIPGLMFGNPMRGTSSVLLGVGSFAKVWGVSFRESL